MENSLIIAAEPLPDGDGVSVRRWFAAYALGLLVATGALAILLTRQTTSADWAKDFVGTFSGLSAETKLLGFAIYLSWCCTFLPLPTGWIAAAVATQAAAVGGNLWTTTAWVALVGGLASTVANLNDYHLMTWMLRSRRIAKVRRTRTVRRASRWFARSPFAIVLLFNVIPIPVDVIRMLAVTYRYPRAPFAAANFLGRLIRYAVIAAATYAMGAGGWIASVALLGVAVGLAMIRLVPAGVRKIAARDKPGPP